MILSGKEIEKRLDKDIIINPYSPSRLNPNSYNLRLHHELLVYDEPYLDMKKPNAYHQIVIPPEGLLLETNKLYLELSWTPLFDRFRLACLKTPLFHRNGLMAHSASVTHYRIWRRQQVQPKVSPALSRS